MSGSHPLVEHRGAQREMFTTGKAGRCITLSELPHPASLHALGPCEHLDGEITVLRGEAHVSKVRGDGFVVEHGLDHGAIFLAWTHCAQWRDIPAPSTVKGYVDLQAFVREEARRLGIDPTAAFPFLLSGTVAEMKWHINIDITNGAPVTRELFQQGKKSYRLAEEAVRILGFYSESHAGVFISEYAPAVDKSRGERNCVHMHFVSDTGNATGHVDDLSLDGRMVLRLPALR